MSLSTSACADTLKAGAMSPKIFGDRNFAFGYVPEIRGPCRQSAMPPKIFGDRNFAFGYVPEIRDRRGLDMSRKVIV